MDGTGLRPIDCPKDENFPCLCQQLCDGPWGSVIPRNNVIEKGQQFVPRLFSPGTPNSWIAAAAKTGSIRALAAIYLPRHSGMFIGRHLAGEDFLPLRQTRTHRFFLCGFSIALFSHADAKIAANQHLDCPGRRQRICPKPDAVARRQL